MGNAGAESRFERVTALVDGKTNPSWVGEKGPRWSLGAQTLEQHIGRERGAVAAFSRLSGISRPDLSKILRGDMGVSLKRAGHIERLLDGKIPAEAWRVFI